MKRLVSMGAGACLALGIASISPGQQPPPRPPVVSPPDEKPAKPLPPKITLGSKSDPIFHGKHGDALAKDGKIDVKTSDEGDELQVTITGVAAAHCFLGCHSAGIQTFRLVQEFEVATQDIKVDHAKLSLEAKLQGYVRSVHKGSACLRTAWVRVSPASGGPSTMEVAFPPISACGACGGQKVDQKDTSEPASPLPLGHYVLEAELVLEANAEGIINGRGVADFSSDDLPDPWKQDHDPFKDEDRKDFGFSITVKAEAPEPPAGPSSGHRLVPARRLAASAPSARS